MGKRETFVVHILSQENSTWQGKITWVNQKETIDFRSFLEMAKLMDNAMASEQDGKLQGDEYVVPQEKKKKEIVDYCNHGRDGSYGYRECEKQQLW